MWILYAPIYALILATAIGCKNEDLVACSLNGVCVYGVCKCDPGWKGTSCSTLVEGKTTPIWPPKGTEGADPECPAAGWGAGILPPIPNVTDDFHLYVNVNCLSPEMKCAHSTYAQVVHARSDFANGTYVFSDIAIPPSTQNPAIVWNPFSKLFHIFYWEMCLGGRPHCPQIRKSECTGRVYKANNGSFAQVERRRLLFPEAQVANKKQCIQEIGHEDKTCTKPGMDYCGLPAIMSSESPYGPWNRTFPVVNSHSPTIAVGVFNPAPLILKNGTVVMSFRGNPPNGKPAGEVLMVTTANSWEGPYNVIASNITNPLKSDHRLEDPDFFKNERGFHMLSHQYNGTYSSGIHMFSADAHTWHVSDEPAYIDYVNFVNGTSKWVGTRERPRLVTDEKGKPEWLITGVEVGKKSNSFPNCYSETVLTKIKG